MTELVVKYYTKYYHIIHLKKSINYAANKNANNYNAHLKLRLGITHNTLDLIDWKIFPNAKKYYPTLSDWTNKLRKKETTQRF